MIGDGIMDKDIYIYTGWWFQPLWKIWVRQLGWWNSQLNGKIKTGSKPPTSIYTYIYIYISATPWGIRLIGEPIHNIYDLNLGPSQIFFDWTMNLRTIGGWCFDKEYQSYPTQQSNFDMGKTQGKPTHQLCKKMIDHQEVLQKDQRWETWLVGLQTPKAAGWISGILWVYIMILGTSVYDTVDGPAKS